MSRTYIDTNVIVGYITHDDPEKQAAAARLMQRVFDGELAVAVTDTIIADCVFVLSSPRLYRLPRGEVAKILLAIVREPNVLMPDRQITAYALDLYGNQNIKYDDAFIIATMKADGSSQLYSWDRGFDRIPGIERIEP